MKDGLTKLVCVGWGIWDIVQRRVWRGYSWDTRKEAIEVWNDWYGEDSYHWCRQRSEVIAKRLWMEVKDDRER